jgi:hypothetical protein
VLITHPSCAASPDLFARRRQRRSGKWLVVLLFLIGCLSGRQAEATDLMVLGQDVQIRQAPNTSAEVIKMARPGETYEAIGRKSGKGNPLYTFDERGDLWVKVRVNDHMSGFVRTDLVSMAREEFRSPRGSPLLIVNLRRTPDGEVDRELWVVTSGWQNTRRLALIEGQPIWASHGEWFICQVDSERPVKDTTIDRTIERIEKFSADGRARTLLAAGSSPLLHEPRGKVYFYRDVDKHGEAVPPGLFAVNVDGGNLQSLFLLPERHRFWKEDGDFFVQAPPPALHASINRITLWAFDRAGALIRFTITLDGRLVELRFE